MKKPILMNLSQMRVLSLVDHADLPFEPELWADCHDDDLDSVVEVYNMAVNAELLEFRSAPVFYVELLLALMRADITATAFYLSQFITEDDSLELYKDGDERQAIYARARAAMTVKIGHENMLEAATRVHEANMACDPEGVELVDLCV
jgi:hypothetical protein